MSGDVGQHPRLQQNQADSDAAAVDIAKQLVRKNIPDDLTIDNMLPDAGDSEIMECVIFRKTVHTNYHEHGVIGEEGTEGGERVAGWAFRVTRTADGGFSVVDD